VRAFDELVTEAEAVDVTGWGFEWLDGRATEERPPWGYARLLAERLPRVASALDIDTGGGEVLAEMPAFPPRMCATESWPPNARRAATLLGPRGVEVVETREGGRLPFLDRSFELVVSRHPVRPNWSEIARVLTDGGRYLAQHVGPASAFELIEYFLGPFPEERTGRDPHHEVAEAKAAGLEVVDLRTARCRMEFFDRLHPAQVRLVGAGLQRRALPGHPAPPRRADPVRGAIRGALDAAPRRGSPMTPTAVWRPSGGDRTTK
jgi:SAM-dependent methyltransferase